MLSLFPVLLLSSLEMVLGLLNRDEPNLSLRFRACVFAGKYRLMARLNV